VVMHFAGWTVKLASGAITVCSQSPL